jgi:urease accessory protein
MHKLVEKITAQGFFPADTTLTLPYESRIKARLHVYLDNGMEAGLFLPRGLVLRDGDLLRAEDDLIVLICAAEETVSTVYTNDPLLLARLCFHLGNRHTHLQITPAWLRYQHDHVLDDMVISLGGEVTVENAPFEPEAGAYSETAPQHHHHSH